MDIVPGDVQHAGVTEFVRSRDRRRFDYHRLAHIVRRAVNDAAGAGEEAAAAVVMPGERREGGTRRRKPCAARGARIGRRRTRGKNERNSAEGGDLR